MPETAIAAPRPLVSGGSARPSGGSSANLPLLRDPDHYEEINVIGTGKNNMIVLVFEICPLKDIKSIILHIYFPLSYVIDFLACN